MTTISAEIICDSLSRQDKRLTTMLLKYPRFIHAEFLTHRAFCLSGDTHIKIYDSKAMTFAHPTTLQKFAAFWHFEQYMYSIKSEKIYSASRIAEIIKIFNLETCNAFCRSNLVKNSMTLNYEYFAYGKDWKEILKQEIKDARFEFVKNAVIHQLDEKKRSIEFASIKNCSISGVKNVYRLFTRNNFTIKASKNHLFRAETGWKKLKDLKSGDKVVISSDYNTYEFVEIDYIEYAGKMDTYDLEIGGEFPNFLANNFVVHNSRNSASTRAIPLTKAIEAIKQDPVVPLFWGKAKPGMQMGEPWDKPVHLQDSTLTKEQAWLQAQDKAVEIAQAFDKAGLHKSISGRLLEPFSHISVVVSATEWDNFFALRNSDLAEPHLQMLAKKMLEAHAKSLPILLENKAWHLPFVRPEDLEFLERYLKNSKPPLKIPGVEDALLMLQIMLSVARCASVSYQTVDMQYMTVEKAINLYNKLANAKPLHASPMEHQATPDEKIKMFGNYYWVEPEHHNNFVGWKQFRSILQEDFSTP